MPCLFGELQIRRACREVDPDASAQNHSPHRSAQACGVILRVTSPVFPFQVYLQVAVCPTRPVGNA
eukprot:2308034-Alexandrium_andersonii.AAC.1